MEINTSTSTVSTPEVKAAYEKFAASAASYFNLQMTDATAEDLAVAEAENDINHWEYMAAASVQNVAAARERYNTAMSALGKI